MNNFHCGEFHIVIVQWWEIRRRRASSDVSPTAARPSHCRLTTGQLQRNYTDHTPREVPTVSYVGRHQIPRREVNPEPPTRRSMKIEARAPGPHHNLEKWPSRREAMLEASRARNSLHRSIGCPQPASPAGDGAAPDFFKTTCITPRVYLNSSLYLFISFFFFLFSFSFFLFSFFFFLFSFFFCSCYCFSSIFSLSLFFEVSIRILIPFFFHFVCCIPLTPDSWFWFAQ